MSGSQIRRLLKQKKYVHLWAKYSLESKRNPEKRKVFYQKLQEYFKIEKDTPERLQVWFWDESGFSLRVIRRKTWCQRGTQKKVRGDRRKGRVNVMGGIRNSDKKRFVDFLSSNSNAENFYQVIRLFYDEIKNEWCQTGGQREKFAEQGPKIVVILDNATFHKKPDWLQKIATHMPNIHLEFLPEYSPDLNIIELVWHAAKEYLANRVFTFIEELEQLLHKLLNEGELIIHWGRKLKNKGNAVVAI